METCYMNCKSRTLSSSNGIQLYQQNSNLQGGVQVMCMHPWCFSIGRWHFGQGLELASILKMSNHDLLNHLI
jgi:hypothetical protein